jgi:hypothetical protein
MEMVFVISCIKNLPEAAYVFNENFKKISKKLQTITATPLLLRVHINVSAEPGAAKEKRSAQRRRKDKMNTNMMELSMEDMELVNGGDIISGAGKGACAGAAGGAFIGGVTLGFPGATFGTLIGAVGGAVVGGIVGAFTD